MPLQRKGRRHHWPHMLLASLVVVTISSIMQSSKVDLVLHGDDVALETYSAPVLDNQTSVVLQVLNVSSTLDSKIFPRFIFWNDTFVARQGRKIKDSMSTNPNEVQNRSAVLDKPLYRKFEEEWYTKCQPLEEIPVRPTCNSLHEMDAFSDGSSSSPITLLSMDGSWRSVWKSINPMFSESIILKLLHLHREFEQLSVQAHEMDIRVMERLTASPRVVSAFGFCGHSVLTQFAQSSGAKVIKDPTLTWRDRLIIARDLARGLAELHALQPIHYNRILAKEDKKSDPLDLLRSISWNKTQIFAHYDINIANTVSLKPKQVQWNDFNLGVMSQKRTDGTGECAVPVQFEGVLWRSPEEIQNSTGQLASLHPADVYAFGTLLFTVFTKHQPWTHLENGHETPSQQEIARKKLRGDMPNLPPKYQPKRKEAKVLWAATRACFRRDPQQRPTAYQLAMSLGLALELFQSRKELTNEMIELLFAP